MSLKLESICDGYHTLYARRRYDVKKGCSKVRLIDSIRILNKLSTDDTLSEHCSVVHICLAYYSENRESIWTPKSIVTSQI